MNPLNPLTVKKLRAALTLLAVSLVLPSTILLAQDRVEAVSRPEESKAQKSDAEKSSQATPVADVLIGEGDLLQVSIFGVPDFNEQGSGSGAKIIAALFLYLSRCRSTQL